ncbi:MAG: aldehyde dehydrogenase family protein [Flavobacteriaceae bacterium]
MQSDFFKNGKTLHINTRKAVLKALKQSVKTHEADISAALKKDLGKPAAEIWLAEIYIVLDELNTVIKNLQFWAKPKRIKGKWLNTPSKDWIVPEPFGVTLHIAPWNYPFQLALNSVIGAVAAGNTVVLKPSEHAPHTAAVIEKIITAVFPEVWVTVVQGGPETAENLLKLRWDYIFFTGGVRVGKLVAKAAAVHLTPTTLELGGKNPCIVDQTANIKVSARRIAWGKYMNCGQICMSPDYLLVHKSKYEALLTALKFEIVRMYGDNAKTSVDYARLVHEKHAVTMVNLLDGQDILYGGEHDVQNRYVAPTIVAVDNLENIIMQGEIFGPILPILTYEDETEIDRIILHYDKPLSFYVFSERKKWANKLMKKHSYGGGMINDVIVYFTNQRLPFGGIGNSGVGSYHGKYSFDTFTHLKSYVARPTWFDPIQRYAPYSKSFPVLQKILRLFS